MIFQRLKQSLKKGPHNIDRDDQTRPLDHEFFGMQALEARSRIVTRKHEKELHMPGIDYVIDHIQGVIGREDTGAHKASPDMAVDHSEDGESFGNVLGEMA